MNAIDFIIGVGTKACSTLNGKVNFSETDPKNDPTVPTPPTK
jgi:hypothetical protein